jgi:SNF2 family DNA or RNA helicase
MNSKNLFFLLFVNLEVGALGFDMSSCKNIIFLDPVWNAQLMAQAIGRINRNNQISDMKVIVFVTMNTIEEVMFKKLITKYYIFQNLFYDEVYLNFKLINELNKKKFGNKISFSHKFEEFISNLKFK